MRQTKLWYLILIGLGGKLLVQGSNFSGQVLEAIPEHFLLQREQVGSFRAALPGKLPARNDRH